MGVNLNSQNGNIRSKIFHTVQSRLLSLVLLFSSYSHSYSYKVNYSHFVAILIKLR